MQLKIRRSQRESGVLSKNVIFCLDARADFTPQEQHSITRYRLQNQVIYNSEASKHHLAKAAAHNDGSFGGGLKSLASVAMAAMKLNITISSLQRGQHVECKSLDELLGAEEAIMTACQNLKGYLDTAATFDGREVLFDFETGGPQVIAHAAAPALVAPTAALPPPPALAAALAIPAPVTLAEQSAADRLMPESPAPVSDEKEAVYDQPLPDPSAHDAAPYTDEEAGTYLSERGGFTSLPSEQQLVIIIVGLVALVVLLILGRTL